MPVAHEGLEREIGYVTKPFEIEHIRGLFEGTDPLMHEMAYNLIVGNRLPHPRKRVGHLGGSLIVGPRLGLPTWCARYWC